MSAEILFENFDLLAEAPNGADTLRDLVLKMGMRGVLVSQDSSDESADSLLDRIKTEHLLSSERVFIPIVASELPFKIPSSWQWVRFSQIVDYRFGRTPETKVSAYWDDKGTKWVSIADMIHYGTITTTKKGVSEKALNEVFRTKPIPAGTLLMSFKLTIGKVSILGVDAYHNEAIISIFPAFEEFKSYLFYFLPLISKQGELNNAIKGQTLNTDSLSNLLVPLPPLNEQRRIVAKVDQLMALCDELEGKQKRRNEARISLNSSALDHLLATKDQREFDAHWQRINSNFDLLYDKPETVGELRQAILQLAVQGKLVIQDPKDEPATKLLASINRSIAEAVKARQMRNPKEIAVNESALLFDLPSGWEWSQLGKITAAEDNAMCDGPFGSKLKTEHYIEAPGYSVIRLGNIGVGRFIFGKEGRITREHYESLKSNHTIPGDLIVAGLADPLVRCCEVPPELGPAVNKADCFRVRLHKQMDRTYVQHYLNSKIAKAFAAEENHGMTRERINLANAKSLPVPIPPFAEQRRIVAKIGRLMTICDELETNLMHAEKASEELMEAVVREAVDN